MRQLALHQAEFILLKLIIFLNVDLCNFLPESQSLLISEKEKAIQELFNYENSYLGVNAGLRFGQILLLTPKIYVWITLLTYLYHAFLLYLAWNCSFCSIL